MTEGLLVRNVRPADGEGADVLIRTAHIAAIGRAITCCEMIAGGAASLTLMESTLPRCSSRT